MSKLLEHAAYRHPVLASDILCRPRHKPRPSVFLCGAAPSGMPHDHRHQTKRTLARRFRAKPFLGEEIPGIMEARAVTGEKSPSNMLNIEVAEAKNADIVVIFLASPGAIVEFTAFALNDDIREKLIVFHDPSYLPVDSFVSQGPLKLLSREQLQTYDRESPTLDPASLRPLDRAVAAWRYRNNGQHSFGGNRHLYTDMCLALAYIASPASYTQLANLFPWPETALIAGLQDLFEASLIHKHKDAYHLSIELDQLGLSPALEDTLANLRCRFIASQLVSADDEQT